MDLDRIKPVDRGLTKGSFSKVQVLVNYYLSMHSTTWEEEEHEFSWNIFILV
jgi:hypothetical protein